MVEYFISRHLYPNIDFYSGCIYKAMGFPSDFFPVLFSIARTSGWLAHWREQIIVFFPIMLQTYSRLRFQYLDQNKYDYHLLLFDI